MLDIGFIPVGSGFAFPCRNECATAPPLLPHWRKLRCHPITAAACQVLHLTWSVLQKTHVGVKPRNKKKCLRCFCFTDVCDPSALSCILEHYCFILISDLLDNGLPSGHAVLGLSPSVGQGVRESDVTSVEHGKENRRTHCDRGLCRTQPRF